MSVWSGKHLWIWYVQNIEGGDPQAIARRAHELGLDGVLIKYHDGGRNPVSYRFRDQFLRVVTPLKAAGLTVGAWGYLYGNNVDQEAAFAAESIQNGADWYVIDAEAEFEGRPEAARLWGEHWQKAAPVGAPIGFAPFGIPSYHPRYPYREFAEFCDVVLPQVYWAAFGWSLDRTWQRFTEDFATLALPAAMAPIGQAYDKTRPEDIRDFGRRCQDAAYDGVSYWAWDHATAPMQEAIARAWTKGESGPFPDVPGDHWAAEDVRLLKELGILKGWDDGLFHGEETTRRYELAASLARLWRKVQGQP